MKLRDVIVGCEAILERGLCLDELLLVDKMQKDGKELEEILEALEHD